MQMNQSAAVFIGEDRILMQPQDASPYGNYAGLPVRTLPHASSLSDVLDNLEQTLKDSRTIVDPPKDLKALLKPLIAASGEKTWSAISKSFAYVGVSEKDDVLTVFSGFPEKGSFLFRTEAHWHCNKQDKTQKALAFCAAARVAIEAQNLSNPPQLR